MVFPVCSPGVIVSSTKEDGPFGDRPPTCSYNKRRQVIFLAANTPSKSMTRKNAIAMKKRIFAIPAEVAAMPPKPKIAATMAITRKIMAQRNIRRSVKEAQIR